MNSVTIGFRVDAQVKRTLLQRAEELGVNLSDVAEAALLKGLEPESKGNGHSRPATLSEEDLDHLSDLFADKLTSFREELEENLLELLTDGVEEDEEPDADETKDIVEEKDLETLLAFLELPELQQSNLETYIHTAADHLQIPVNAVVAKMLAYAYDQLRPGNGDFFGFSTGVGDVEDEVALLGEVK